VIRLRPGLGTTTEDLAQAIGRFEGVNVSGSLAQVNNNPGNLRSGTGQIGTDSHGFAIFPDMATGYSALDHQIDLNVARGLTLDQFFGGLPGVYAGYAPAADSNNPGQYSQTVAGWLGIDPNVPLTQVLDSGTADTSNSAFSDLTAALPDLSTALDLPTLTGLSWPVLGGIAGAVVLLVIAIRR
jgi:hypothetical protein